VLLPQSGDIPFATPTQLSAEFWAACRRGELIYQYFPASGRAQFNPAPIDRVSLSSEFQWRVSAGRGQVYSWSVVHRPQTPSFATPYVAAIVELDEGFRMVSNIVGCEPEAVQVGLGVTVLFHRVNDELTLPYFAPA
jgi:uncharacterized OB-fold protein